MNRLVIVGNGFDLAHGLPTRYGDFLFWYIKSAVIESQQVLNVAISDPLINVISQKSITFRNEFGYEGRFEDLEHLLEDKDIWWIKGPIPNEAERILMGRKELNTQRELESRAVRIRFNSDFFKLTLENKNWTDLEQLYFDYMLNLFANGKQITDLNQEFSFLKQKFVEYLTLVEKEIPKQKVLRELEPVINRCFEEPEADELERFFGKLYFRNRGGARVNRTLFLNFNYTTLLSEYLGYDSQPSHVIYQVHGTTGNRESIIFGYGDDSHEKYAELENAQDDELLRNIKSFYYPSQKYYVDLMNFVESEDFEVYVLGHSLGLSDRILLKAIFESKMCKAIRLFHRGTEQSQFRKRIALSRHFSDKLAMRKKIIEFDLRDIMGG